MWFDTRHETAESQVPMYMWRTSRPERVDDPHIHYTGICTGFFRYQRVRSADLSRQATFRTTLLLNLFYERFAFLRCESLTRLLVSKWQLGPLLFKLLVLALKL